MSNDEQLWKKSNPVGAPRLIETAEQLHKMILDYFQWAENNPLEEEVVSFYQGYPSRTTVTKMRALTVMGCCAYLGLDRQLWYNWKTGSGGKKVREDLLPVIKWAEDIMYEQKFSGAAAGLLNASIIARDLGLVEKQEVNGTTVVIQGKDAEL